MAALTTPYAIVPMPATASLVDALVSTQLLTAALGGHMSTRRGLTPDQVAELWGMAARAAGTLALAVSNQLAAADALNDRLVQIMTRDVA